MRALSPVQGAGVLLGVCLMSAVVVVGSHLLRPNPAALLGDVPEAPRASCEDDVLRQDPITVRSGTLFSCPERFEGRRVRLQGEAIGDLLGRGRERWVLLNDDDYAFAGPLVAHQQTLGTNGGIPVLLGEAMIPTTLGGPRVWGDLLEVTGT
ncbi:MAG TPA: hypothetical protein VMM13_11985, partial [Euzebya sp.]|nr:hypothetical protein [Euzebya sp.]